MRVFRDLTGGLKAITVSEVVLAFMRVGYPRIQKLLRQLEACADADAFIPALLDFEYHLVRTVMDKAHKSSETLVVVMQDAFLVMANVSRRL